MPSSLPATPQASRGALKRIAGHKRGSVVRHSRAVECSHLFFANGTRRFLNLLRSHPPIRRRILRVDPSWDGPPVFEKEEDLGEVVGVFEGTLAFISHTAGHQPATAVDDMAAKKSYLTTFDATNWVTAAW